MDSDGVFDSKSVILPCDRQEKRNKKKDDGHDAGENAKTPCDDGFIFRFSVEISCDFGIKFDKK